MRFHLIISSLILLLFVYFEYTFIVDQQKIHRSTIPVITVDPHLPLNIQRYVYVI